MTATPYWLRLLIALDALGQAAFRYGTLGVTVSSRIGTGCAHGHRWALAAQWLLERSIPLRWIFGPGHCKGAVQHDIDRAYAAIAELTDPVVNDWRES